MKSPAQLSTKLAAALLEAGWSWEKIQSETGLSDRTIRRARREIDLGPLAQVGHIPAQVGHAPAQVGHAPAQVGQAPAQVGQALTRAQIFSL